MCVKQPVLVASVGIVFLLELYKLLLCIFLIIMNLVNDHNSTDVGFHSRTMLLIFFVFVSYLFCCVTCVNNMFIALTRHKQIFLEIYFECFNCIMCVNHIFNLLETMMCYLLFFPQFKWIKLIAFVKRKFSPNFGYFFWHEELGTILALLWIRLKGFP